MSPRQVVPLLYGAGLDRATGVFAVDARSGRDLRNVYLYRDKLQVRHGHSAATTLVEEDGVTPLEDTVLVQSMSAEQIGLVAGIGSDGRVHLFRVSGDGSGLSQIGIAFTLAAGAHSPPRLLAAEQYSKIFVAHDETIRSLRAATVYYDPYGAPALKTLTADLDGDTVAGDVLFRGVAPYLTYLVGWGFGTETDPDHPEVVRVSDPEDPTSLAPDDYFQAGTGGSPVLNCLPAGSAEGSSLLVLKPVETHLIFGYDKRTFGIRLLDSTHGIVGSRLAYSHNGVVYAWGVEGPWRSSGGPAEDIAWPLDLDAPSPADLIAAGDAADGFACYLPGRRCILFVFGERVYVLSLWDPSALKWSYGELGFAAHCGGVLYSGFDAPSTAPTAEAGNVVLTVNSDEEIGVAWDNGVINPLTGGEIAEIWFHATTPDTWELKGQVAASGASQTLNVAVDAGTAYEAQIRYRRGPYYRADYESADPDDWPAVSLSNTVTTTLATPVLSTAWARVSATVERINLTWTGSQTAHSEVRRGATLLATIEPGAPLAYTDDAFPAGEANYTYTVTQVTPDDSEVSAGATQWAGPTPGLTSLDTFTTCNNGGVGHYYVAWTTTNPAQVRVRHLLNSTPPLVEDTRTAAASYSTDVPGSVPGNLLQIYLDHVETAYGVDDFSPATVSAPQLISGVAC